MVFLDERENGPEALATKLIDAAAEIGMEINKGKTVFMVRTKKYPRKRSIISIRILPM